ncbi:phage tail-collar fiber domain-containing protein [Enterobacter hormaechei]|uniref:phage tail-collar fiber domain-containing protein n=1 Tax=Enterobacter hormaechei TaxID=158836 RepID=UPI00073575BD|nr:phage tail protein [Enterobacter hormaechei]HAS1749990.1 hypothetical protein [Enterobacter hormaechei subsp. oharae]KTG93682.1 hypothetical protein ASV34_16150 [Enterobacter hormaechei subsp. xiangfangensis]KTG98733.1 hypothetical protein ASV33_16110 [Enterobacter hormaechei subsp. xiangfangensis]KTH98091.1 hypothetical protein ASV12_05535 [Enterobacter hormaechei subsp. xiangfangensis]KTI87858.1 hypothetical protein ASU94_14765 [Enterobacter hormaechei subsp. xiangfangensis]
MVQKRTALKSATSTPDDKIYAILTDRGAELEAAALATGVPVKLTKFVIGDANGQEEVTPDPARTALIHEVYRGDINGAESKGNQVTFTLDVPPETGGYTIREVGILTEAGELYSVARSPDILKPTESNGAVISITFKYILAVSSTSTVTVVVYNDYLTPDAADARYLKVNANLKEIADNGASSQQLARKNIGIDGDIAYRDKENIFTKKNTFGEILYVNKSIVLSGDWAVSWSLAGAYIEAYRNTSMVLINTTGDFEFSAADSAGNNPLKVNISGKKYNVYNEANLKPVKTVNNKSPDAYGNVTIDTSSSSVTITNIGTNQWATMSGSTIIDITATGISSNSTSNPDVTVTLARSFPSRITCISGSFTGDGGSNEDSWWSATPINSGSFMLHTRNMNGTFSFIIKGV